MVVALAVPMHAAGIALRYDGSPLALFHVLMVVVMTVMVVALVPVTMRRRRGVRRFRELYDLAFPESS